MEPISLPTNIEFKKGKSPNHGMIVVEPCYPGYGTTLGNALRRVLLASLPGAAVTAIKITGVQHEFDTVPGVKEDVVEIILNLKSLKLKVFTDEPVILKLNVRGEKKVTAADIEPSSDVEIVAPDTDIATLTAADAKLEMELTVTSGRGYLEPSRREKSKHEIGTIAIDAIFTPVSNVGFKVENVRVGQMTNYDKLILDIETDGTISPRDAMEAAAKILIEHFGLMANLSPEEVERIKKGIAETEDEKESAIEEAAEKEKKVEIKKEKKESPVAKEEPKKKRGRPRKQD